MIRSYIGRALICLCLVCLLLPVTGGAASADAPKKVDATAAPEGLAGGAEARVDAETFAKMLLALLRQEAPDVAFTQGDGMTIFAEAPDGAELEVNLENVYAEYARGEDATGDVLAWFAGIILEYLQGSGDGELRPENILPVIKNDAYVEALRVDSFYPLLQGFELEGLYILYVEDTPSMVNLLQEDVMNSLDIEQEDLRSVATENLLAVLPEAELVQIEELGIGIVWLDGMYESSLLLMPPGELYEYPVEGELVVAVPARDAFFLADSADPASVAVLREYAETVFAESGYPVTDRLIVWRDGAFVWFEEG